MVGAAKPQEAAHLLESAQTQTFLNSLNFHWVRCDATWRHLESQVLLASGVKFILAWFGIQVVLAKFLQHLMDMVIVLCHTVEWMRMLS